MDRQSPVLNYPPGTKDRQVDEVTHHLQEFLSLRVLSDLLENAELVGQNGVGKEFLEGPSP